jgi:hypothetical protein
MNRKLNRSAELDRFAEKKTVLPRVCRIAEVLPDYREFTVLPRVCQIAEEIMICLILLGVNYNPSPKTSYLAKAAFDPCYIPYVEIDHLLSVPAKLD